MTPEEIILELQYVYLRRNVEVLRRTLLLILPEGTVTYLMSRIDQVCSEDERDEMTEINYVVDLIGQSIKQVGYSYLRCDDVEEFYKDEPNENQDKAN